VVSAGDGNLFDGNKAKFLSLQLKRNGFGAVLGSEQGRQQEQGSK
jgi:hypothetical protein